MTPTPKSVINAVADHFGVSEADLLEVNRGDAHTALARQWCMDVMRRVLGWSSPRVGEYFGRDHSTVLHASRVVGKQVANGKAQDMAALVASLQGHNGKPPPNRARPGTVRPVRERDEVSVVLASGGVVSLRLSGVRLTQLDDTERALVLGLIDELRGYAHAQQANACEAVT